VVIDELEDYLAGIDGLSVNRLVGADGNGYLVIKIDNIDAGSLAGRSCEIAILRSMEQPWVPQAALHIRPLLVPMGTHSTQQSPIGSEWQYFSRRYDRVPTPKSFLAHVFTVLAEI